MKKRVTIGVLLMAILMLAGCRPSVPPTETTDEITNEMTNGQPDTTDFQTEADTKPPELPDQTVALPYTVTTAHQASVRVLGGHPRLR